MKFDLILFDFTFWSEKWKCVGGIFWGVGTRSRGVPPPTANILV